MTDCSEQCFLWKDDCPLRCAGTGYNDPPVLYVSAWFTNGLPGDYARCQCQKEEGAPTEPVFIAEGVTRLSSVIEDQSANTWFQDGPYSVASFTAASNLVAFECLSPNEALICGLSPSVDFATSTGQLWHSRDIDCAANNGLSRLRNEMGEFGFLSDKELSISNLVDTYTTGQKGLSLVVATTAQGWAAPNVNGTRDVISEGESYYGSFSFSCNPQQCFDQVQAFMSRELKCGSSNLFASNATETKGDGLSEKLVEEYGLYLGIAAAAISLVAIVCCIKGKC